MIRYVLDSQVSDLVVSVSEVKDYLRIDYDYDDTLIEELIKAATEIAEKCMNRNILTATWISYRDSFHADPTLRRGKFISVSKIEYLNNDAYVEMPTTDYKITIGGVFGVICNADNITHDCSCDAVKVTFDAGYGSSTTDVPEDIKTAIKSHVAFLYENRGSCNSSEMPTIANVIYKKNTILDLGPGELNNGYL